MHSAEASALCGGKRDGMRHKRLPARPICQDTDQSSRFGLLLRHATRGSGVRCRSGDTPLLSWCSPGPANPARRAAATRRTARRVSSASRRRLPCVGKLHLEGELSDQSLVLAASAPQSDVALADQAFAEVQLTQGQQDFLDNATVDQADRFPVRLLRKTSRAGKTLSKSPSRPVTSRASGSHRTGSCGSTGCGNRRPGPSAARLPL